MRRLLVAFLLSSTLAFGQIYPPDSGGTAYEGGSVTNPLLAPTGCSPMGYAFDGDPDTGMCQNGPDFLSFRAGGTEFLRYIGGSVLELMHPVAGASATIITNGVSGGGGSSAGRVEMRQHSVTSFSNRLYFAPELAVETSGYISSLYSLGAPTYTAAFESSGVNFLVTGGVQSSVAGATYAHLLFSSASGLNDADVDVVVLRVDGYLDADFLAEWDGKTNDANNTRLGFIEPTAANVVNFPDASGTVPAFQPGTSTLTDATATNAILFSISDQTFATGTVIYNTVCIDATEQIMVRDKLEFACFNDADTETCTFSSGDRASIATGGATMTPTFDITSGTNTLTFRVNADCSLTPTTLETAWEIRFATGDPRVVTEQN